MNNIELEIQGTVVLERVLQAIEEGYRYIKLVGGSRSSKTHSIIQALYIYGATYENKRISVFRATKENNRKTVGNDAKQQYLSLPFTKAFNKTSFNFELTNNSVIEITGTDDPNIVHGYNTNVVGLNEPYDIPKAVFDQLDLRASDFIIIDMNPKEDHWSEDIERDPRCKVIHCTFKDNPFCPKNERQKILSYLPVSFTEVVLNKLISVDDARQYDLKANRLKFTNEQLEELALAMHNEAKNSASEFDWQVYGLGTKAERPNRIFKWLSISKEEFDRVDAETYYGVDWGMVDPFAVVAVKYKDGQLYVHELNYDSENQLLEALNVQTIAEIRMNEEGVVGWLFDKLRIPYTAEIICDSSQPSKVKALREAGWENAISIGHKGKVVERISTMQQIKTYYTITSKNIKKEQEFYSRKTDRYGVVLEEPEDKDNHCMDAIGYVVIFLKRKNIIKTI